RCGQAFKRGPFRPKKADRPWAGSSRTIGAAYKGGPPCRQCGGRGGQAFFETAHLARIIQWLRCITSLEGVCLGQGPRPGLIAGLDLTVFGGEPTSCPTRRSLFSGNACL